MTSQKFAEKYGHNTTDYSAHVKAEHLSSLKATLQLLIQSKERIRTEWCVITGAPGSGKTTLIRTLASRGFRVVEDPARMVLENRIAQGVSKHAARENYIEVQQQVLSEMWRAVEQIGPQQLVFFDYALPDNLAFLELQNFDWPQEFVNAACRFEYKRVFLVDDPNLLNRGLDDQVRTETNDQRRRLNNMLREIYADLGIPLTTIAGNTEFRFNTIFSALNG